MGFLTDTLNCELRMRRERFLRHRMLVIPTSRHVRHASGFLKNRCRGKRSPHSIFADLVPFSLTVLKSMQYVAFLWDFSQMELPMEVHGTWSAPISMTRAVPNSSMEFRGTWSAPISMTQAIPWGLSSANFDGMSSSMEFLGTWSAPILLTWVVLWNSMEFHGIRSAPIFNGTARIREIGAFQVRRNCSCHRNWRTSSFIESHGIPWNCSCQLNWRTPNSMEFHGTACVSEIGTLQVPWNSMAMIINQRHYCVWKIRHEWLRSIALHRWL